MCLCLSGWCHPCMQRCKAQLECRGEEEGEAHDRTHVHCLQDEAARKDKAGTQSTAASQCCHWSSQKAWHRAQPHHFPHCAASGGTRMGCTVPLTLHCCTCSGSHPGCTVCAQAPCPGFREEGAGPLVLVTLAFQLGSHQQSITHAARWVPTQFSWQGRLKSSCK